ncbi:MAG: ATP-binding protein [Actinobacteria bacterium]|nr:ATP-binding protein [Actinomycetota bacterium]
MATVELSFTALPAHVRTARLVATAVARRSGVDESLLDEVRLAVGEACSRAVEGHQLHCPAEPVRLALTDLAGRFEVEVTDTCGPDGLAPAGSGAAAVGNGGADEAGRAALPAGLGRAVLESLVDDVRISTTAEGTSIRMSWPSAGFSQVR